MTGTFFQSVKTGLLLLTFLTSPLIHGDASESPLIAAATTGDVIRVKALLADKSDVDIRDKDGWTPLHLAVANGHKEIVEVLLANKADMNAQNKEGLTPLHVVSKREIAELLLANKATVDVGTGGDIVTPRW